MWHNGEVDRLHVKRNRIVGINYLGIIDLRDQNEWLIKSKQTSDGPSFLPIHQTIFLGQRLGIMLLHAPPLSAATITLASRLSAPPTNHSSSAVTASPCALTR